MLLGLKAGCSFRFWSNFDDDKFIRREHAEYLARSVPNAELVDLKDVSHFAPLQRPEQFNTAMLAFLTRILP
jgi:pimeloyl-ACP methyl ester carboxylesterase